MNNPNKSLEIEAVLRRGRTSALLRFLRDRKPDAAPDNMVRLSLKPEELAGCWGLSPYTNTNTLKHELSRCAEELALLDRWLGGMGSIVPSKRVTMGGLFNITWRPGSQPESAGRLHLPLDWDKMGIKGRDVFHILQSLAEDEYADDYINWRDVQVMDDYIHVTVSQSRLKEVRRRLAWSKFKEEVDRWRKEKFLVRLEGFDGLVEIPVIAGVEQGTDKDIIKVKLSKRVAFTLQLLKTEL